eukprot:1824018-Rhodomonas_salina.3
MSCGLLQRESGDCKLRETQSCGRAPSRRWREQAARPGRRASPSSDSARPLPSPPPQPAPPSARPALPAARSSPPSRAAAATGRRSRYSLRGRTRSERASMLRAPSCQGPSAPLCRRPSRLPSAAARRCERAIASAAAARQAGRTPPRREPIPFGDGVLRCRQSRDLAVKA